MKESSALKSRFAVCASILLACWLRANPVFSSSLPGDVDQDGNTTLSDVIMGLQIMSGVLVSPPGRRPAHNDPPGLDDVIYALRQNASPQCPASALYVSTGGAATGAGTFLNPMDSLVTARDYIRQLKQDGAYPAEGVTVCMRGGVYRVLQSIEFDSRDSGTVSGPVLYRSYPGEDVVFTGGITAASDWFEPVKDTDAIWSRLDESSRQYIVKMDLAAHGIEDYGQLAERGFRTYSAHSPMELSVDNQMMQLARWPNKNENESVDPTFNAVVSGSLVPDVTGVYENMGTTAEGNADDGYPNYKRQGLVDGKQYYLYHCTWQDGNARYWFISTYDPQYNANCWPKSPWADTPAWAVSGEQEIPPLASFNLSSGEALVADRPEDFKEHGFVRTPEILAENAFRSPGTRHLRWTEADDMWVQGLFGNYWADTTLAATLDGARVELASVPNYGLKLKMPFYYFNLVEELDTPGEYYIDRPGGQLYFYPPETVNEIRLSHLDEAILSIENTHNIQFSGFTLEMSRGDLVRITDSDHLKLEEMVLRNTGGTAVRISGTENVIDKCEIYGAGGGGVYLDGGSRTTLTAANNLITDTVIHDYARWDRTYKPAVHIQGVGNRVEHNYIHDAPHFGIQFSGNNHLIEYNRIERVTLEANDAAAIYTGRDWGYRGNMIRYNLIKDIDSIFGGSHGAYMDDGASGVTVFGNIFHTINGNAILSGGGRDNIMTNNVMIGVDRAGLHTDRRVRDVINNEFNGDGRPDDWNLLGRVTVSYYNYYYNREPIAYQSPPWATQYPALAVIPNSFSTITGSHWLEPEGCIFSHNITWQTGQLLVNSTWGGAGATDYYSSISPNIHNVDPLFMDEAAGDLNLRPDSPAFGMDGFVPIPFDEIGIRSAQDAGQ